MSIIFHERELRFEDIYLSVATAIAQIDIPFAVQVYVFEIFRITAYRTNVF